MREEKLSWTYFPLTQCGFEGSGLVACFYGDAICKEVAPQLSKLGCITNLK